MNPFISRALAAAAVAWFGCHAASVHAEAQPRRAALGGEPAAAVIWIGNSFFYYNNGIHRLVGGLASADKGGCATRWSRSAARASTGTTSTRT
jgi:hypothetical protein